VRMRCGQGRMVAFGFGALLCLLSSLPGLAFPTGVVPWWIAGLAFVRPMRAATQQVRMLLLGGAALAAVLALLCWRGVLPPTLAWVLLAAALHLAVHVLGSRPVAETPAPVGPVVAVYGGTFDPFHRGHRALIEAAVRQTERVLVVVAGTPPHKQQAAERTAFHHRVAMTRLGVEGLPRVEVLELEGRRQGPSYTVDTLASLARSYPAGTRFRLVLGADAFQEFPTWHEWEGILERATLLVAARPGHELDVPPEFEGRNLPLERLESAEVDVSSTGLRAVLAQDGDVGDLLAPAVRAYVRDHRLYQPGGAGAGPVELADRPSA
jgi:nicotinate-nucleotide adenylyltransferase